MTVADYVHHEGEHWIIETPVNTYTGRQLNTQFIDGVARTRYQEKAHAFDEQKNYLVIGWEGAPSWANKPDPMVAVGAGPEWKAEEGFTIGLEDEMPFGESEGQFPEPVTHAKAAPMGLTSTVPADNPAEGVPLIGKG